MEGKIISPLHNEVPRYPSRKGRSARRRRGEEGGGKIFPVLRGEEESFEKRKFKSYSPSEGVLTQSRGEGKGGSEKEILHCFGLRGADSNISSFKAKVI